MPEMKIHQQFTRFIFVGGAATLAQYALLVLLVRMNMLAPVAASSVGFGVSSVLNYLMNRRFTFDSVRQHRTAVPRFAVVAISGLALNAASMWQLVTVFGQHYLVSQVIATLFTLAWNFVFHRIWTFQSSQATESS